LQAIDEAEDEWAQHDAKKLIPISGNLRQVIPPNFAYFHVEFGLDRGFAHVMMTRLISTAVLASMLYVGCCSCRRTCIARDGMKQLTDKDRLLQASLEIGSPLIGLGSSNSFICHHVVI
jgi:Protein similar to CwfJ C-terminus 2